MPSGLLRFNRRRIVSGEGVVQVTAEVAAGRHRRDRGHGPAICATKRVACPEGLEPPTCCLEGSCSIQLSYGQPKPRILVTARVLPIAE